MTVFSMPVVHEGSASAPRCLLLSGSTAMKTTDSHGDADGKPGPLAADLRSLGRSSRSRKSRRPVPTAVPTLLVDKSPLFRAGLARFLAESRFRARGSRLRLSDLAASAFGGKHCVALIGLDGEAATVLSVVAGLTARHKGLRVVLLAAQFCPEELLAALEAGASGYLLKNEITADALVQSLEVALLGGIVITRGVMNPPKADRVPVLDAVCGVQGPAIVSDGAPPQPDNGAERPDEVGRLSNREQMVVRLLTQGASNKHIARELAIAEATVKVHIKSLLRKIRVNNRTQAAMWAMERVRPNGPPSPQQFGPAFAGARAAASES
jgi:two-component system nitrate/nitrite response regulator NarL